VFFVYFLVSCTSPLALCTIVSFFMFFMMCVCRFLIKIAYLIAYLLTYLPVFLALRVKVKVHKV